MSKFIEITLDENTTIYIESAKEDIHNNGQFVDVKNSNGVIAKASDYFERSLNQIKTFANSIANSVNDLPSSPKEVELEFAVKFAAEAGIIVTSLNTEANIIVKLKWINP